MCLAPEADLVGGFVVTAIGVDALPAAARSSIALHMRYAKPHRDRPYILT